MAWVRILVDGYSLLHRWPQVAAGQPRHGLAAREELVRRLALYHDAVGTPITVVFDGAGRRGCRPAAPNAPAGVEILFSRSGQTADELIERAAHRLAAWGAVLVVTDDRAERQTVIGLGGSTCSCAAFIRTVEKTLTDLAGVLQHHNRREQDRFRRPR